jgi:signal transduction histidine kinase
MREMPRFWNLSRSSLADPLGPSVVEGSKPLNGGAASDHADLPGHACHLVIDERGIAVKVECPDGEVWGLLRPKVNDSLGTYLCLWNPNVAGAVERARQEHRSVTGEFIARLGPRYCLCTIAYAPIPRTDRGDFWLMPEVKSEPSTKRLFESAFRSEQRAGLVQAILSELNQDRELRQVLSSMLPHLLQALDMEAGAVFVTRDTRAAELLAIHGATHQRGHPYKDLDLADPRIARLAQQPHPVELRPDDALQAALHAVVKRGFTHAMLAPALAGHSVAAYLVVSHSRSRAVGLDAHSTLATVCEALGPLARSHVVSAESQRDAAVLHSSQAVFHAISQSLELNQTYEEIATNAAGAVGGSSCLLLELQSETGDLVTVAASEPEAASLIGLRVRFGSDQDLIKSLKRKRSILVDDLIAGAGVSSEAKRLLSLRSALLVPVFAHGELIGSLIMYSVGRRMRYSERDMARAEEVAEQAAIAIHNARLYRDLVHSRESIQTLARRISEIRQDERQAFASVVHDDIVQSIVGARYLLESFRRSHPGQPAELLDEAVTVLRQTVIDARRVIWELRPPVLDELGLEASLAGLRHHMDRAPGASIVRTDVRRVPPLSRETATAIYKVAREATLNASRHARAKRIWIKLAETQVGQERAVRLSVGDDGVGFDVSALRKEAHFGCAMMEEQATVIGGRLSLESVPGSGTTVSLVVPLVD